MPIAVIVVISVSTVVIVVISVVPVVIVVSIIVCCCHRAMQNVFQAVQAKGGEFPRVTWYSLGAMLIYAVDS